MRSVRRTPLVVMLVAIFVAAHLTCVCAGPAVATAMTVGSAAATRSASDPHACCHRNDTPTPTHHETRVCQHCSNAQLTAPDGVKLSRPSVSALPAFLPVAGAPAALAPSLARRCTIRAGDGHAPPLDHLRTRVLLL